MKLFYLTFLLLIGFMDSHAGTCIVEEGSPESMKRFHDSTEIEIKRTEKDVELVLTLPSEMEEYAFRQVVLVIKDEISDQIEFLVPVATDASLDGESNRAYLLLTLDIFEKADLVVNYGRCALKYRLKLKNIQ